MGAMMFFERDEDRGQVLILIGVVVALAVIASAIALTVNIQASVDRAEGVSKTPSAATSMMTDIDDGISDSIVTANQNDNTDPETHVENLIERQGELFDRVSSYRGHTATVEINETVDGERVYREPGDGDPDRSYADGMDEPFSGGVELNADAVTNASGTNRTRIITDTHEIIIDTTDDDTIRAEIQIQGSDDEIYETQAQNPYVDLGEGSFDGYQFREYDQTDITSVRIENADNSHNSDISDTEVTVELVGKGTFNSAFITEDAVFGVEYTVTVQSDRQETTMTRMATHGPTRGEV